MFNVRLAGGHLYGKQVFTWLSLVVSLMASFVLSFFPLDVLDEIWDLIESVSEGFLTYSFRELAVSRVGGNSFDIKIRNKFFEIKYSASNRFIIFITNDWYFTILEIIWYG